MNNRIKGLVGLTMLSALGVTAANAQPVKNDDTGHYYEVFETGQITWDAAKLALELVDCIKPNGTTEPRVGPTACTTSTAVLPHLATITSSREDEFVDGLRDDVVGDGMRGLAGLAFAQTWIGGVQTHIPPFGSPPCVLPEEVAVDFQCGWEWEDSEGNFPGVNGGTVYSNWNAAEPNDSGTEDHLALGRYGYGLGWNDEAQTRGSIVGYIAEWDVPRPLETCDDPGGCVTIEGHTLSFPAGSLPPPGAGGTLSFNSFEFLDPRVALGTCGTAVLNVLGTTGIGPTTTYPMNIPAYLCGSPKFIVITVDTGGFNITDGTVLVTNDTFTALPGNVYPDGGMSVCEDPITQVQFSDGDPQYQDVVVWQTTDPAGMLENDLGAMEGFPGAAGEFTHDCGGSSRSRTRGGSDFGIGFHIDFGTGNTWALDPDANFERFVALTRYKIILLQESVLDAETSLDAATFKQMKKQINQAIKQLDKGNFVATWDHIGNFLEKVDEGTYKASSDNFNGEHIMRGGNIEFMLRVKVIPYSDEVIPIP